jgi:hypothetical protein
LTQKPSTTPPTIEQRLVNWGHCQRGKGGGSMSTRETRRLSPYGGQGYQCMTNVVCNLMREAASGPVGGLASQAKLDFADSAVVNAAWLMLGYRNKLLLRDLYMLDRRPAAICRVLSIRLWPTSHWMRELEAAHQAIQKIIDSKNSQ